MIVDQIFEKKIGFGRAQWLPMLILCLVDLNDGTQLILSSFLTPIVQAEWKLNQSQISSLTSIFYLAIFVGSICSGRLSDQFGRRPLIICGSFLQIIVSLAFFWVNTYQQMLVARGAYGFSYGFTIAVTTSVFAQILTTNLRGKGIIFLNFCVSIGKLFGLLLAYLFLDSFTSGNWRAMMLCSCLPNLIVLPSSIFILRQSPRFLIAANRLPEAYQRIEEMIATNQQGKGVNQLAGNAKLSVEEKEQIKQYYDSTFSGRAQAEFSTLFNKYYRRTTICLALGWFSINFIYFGQLVVLPFIFGKAHKSFTSYTLTVLGEIPSLLISMVLVDRPNFGRKNSLKYFFMGSAVMHLLFMLNPIVLFSSICRLFMKMCFQMLYPCTTESYNTLNRALGFGFNSAVGRIGATIMPYIILPLLEISIPMISIVFALFGLLGAIASYSLPYETMERALDYQSQMSEEVEVELMKR